MTDWTRAKNPVDAYLHCGCTTFPQRRNVPFSFARHYYFYSANENSISRCNLSLLSLYSPIIQGRRLGHPCIQANGAQVTSFLIWNTILASFISSPRNHKGNVIHHNYELNLASSLFYVVHTTRLSHFLSPIHLFVGVFNGLALRGLA